MKIPLMLRSLGRLAGAVLLSQIVMVLGGVASTALGQSLSAAVSVTPPANGDTQLRADFYLPQADNVSSVNVKTNGTPLDKANVKFTPVDQIQNYSCAVLLVVDKTLGSEPSTAPSRDRLLRLVRGTLGRFSASAFGSTQETSVREPRSGDQRPRPQSNSSPPKSSQPGSSQPGSPQPGSSANKPGAAAERTTGPETSAYQLQLATIGDGNFFKLTGLGCDKASFERAIAELRFDGASPQLFFGLKQAVEYLSPISADRKFLIIISAGVSNDTQTKDQDVIQEAEKSHVHIFTIGLPGSVSATDVQQLQPLAEKTGGYSMQAGGNEPRLPAGTEGDLLRRMISGGRVEVNLAGLAAPVDLEFNVQTQSSSTYNFSYKVENLPVPPTPTPTPTATATATPTPVPTTTPIPTSMVTPTPTPASVGEQIQSWIFGNPVPVLGVGIALLLLGGLVSAVFLLRRRRSTSASEVFDQNDLTELPPSDLTQMAPMGGDTFKPQPLEPELFEPQPFAPEVPALAWLESLDGEQTRYAIRKTAVRIGRKPDNDIVMKNDTVSGHHAEIVKRGDQFTITDLGSSNQVFVAGKPVEKSPLKDGDLIELGEVRLRFLQELDGKMS
jgi:hypothetical protein